MCSGAYAVTLPEADPEAAQRRIRTNALREHARAMDAIYTSWEQGYDPSPDQIDALQTARTRFDEVRPYGWRDAEAAYKKDHSLVAREQCDFGFGAF